MTSGGASLETVGAEIYKNKDVVTGTVGGIVSAIGGESFDSGFWSCYANSRISETLGGGYFGNLVGGSASSFLGDFYRAAENDKKIKLGKTIKKIASNRDITVSIWRNRRLY